MSTYIPDVDMIIIVKEIEEVAETTMSAHQPHKKLK